MQPQPFLSTPEKGTHSPWPHSAHTEVGSWIRETALARVFHRRDGAEALAELLLAVSGKPQEEGDQKKLDDRSEPLAPYHQVQEATLSAFLGFSIHQLQHVPLSADFFPRYLHDPRQFTWGILPLVLRPRSWRQVQPAETRCTPSANHSLHFTLQNSGHDFCRDTYGKALTSVHTPMMWHAPARTKLRHRQFSTGRSGLCA